MYILFLFQGEGERKLKCQKIYLCPRSLDQLYRVNIIYTMGQDFFFIRYSNDQINTQILSLGTLEMDKTDIGRAIWLPYLFTVFLHLLDQFHFGHLHTEDSFVIITKVANSLL